MNPLSKNDSDTRRKHKSSDNLQGERIEDVIINELPSDKSKVIASKISEFARGFKIPDDKKPKNKKQIKSS